MNKKNWQHFILHVTTWEVERHDTTNIGSELGFHCQMAHVESTNDVVHLHNIKR